MAYIPKFYPGSTSVGINRRKCTDATIDHYSDRGVLLKVDLSGPANIATITKEEKRKQKKIDRIVQKAERKQRYQKSSRNDRR